VHEKEGHWLDLARRRRRSSPFSPSLALSRVCVCLRWFFPLGLDRAKASGGKEGRKLIRGTLAPACSLASATERRPRLFAPDGANAPARAGGGREEREARLSETRDGVSVGECSSQTETIPLVFLGALSVSLIASHAASSPSAFLPTYDGEGGGR